MVESLRNSPTGRNCLGQQQANSGPRPLAATKLCHYAARRLAFRQIPSGRMLHRRRFKFSCGTEKSGTTEESMKRLLIPTILCVTYLVFGVGETFAKKKPEKPIQEQFEATISPLTGSRSMTIAIEEFSTNDERGSGVAKSSCLSNSAAFRQ